MKLPRRFGENMTEVPLAQILCALGDVMKECHHHSAELQDAISTTLSTGKADPRCLRTFQGLDHVTQVQEDLTRLLPALARVSGEATGDVNSLARNLQLVSLRDKIFSIRASSSRVRSRPGDVDFF